MSTESVKGSEADNLTTSSEAQNEPKQENSESQGTSSEEAGKTTGTSDSEGEAKIKADAEEAEKQRSPRSASAGSRTGSDKEGDGTDEQKGDVQTARSRSSSGGRKSPGGTSRPRSSDSRPKSTTSSRGSGEVTFEAKAKHRKKKKGGDLIFIEGHQVTFTVTISVAIPTVEEENFPIEDEDAPDIRDLIKKKKRVFEASKAQNYYHLEYYLVPDSSELVKTDVVTYSMAAKIYMERHDPKVLKTWQDGDITWVAWSHSHTVTVTKELLLKLYTHTLELRIWDTKDKVGTRARFDRPKFFGLSNVKPGQDLDEIGGVKAIVMRQSKSFISMQPKKGSEVRPLPKEISFQKPEAMKKRGPTPGGDHKSTSRASGMKPVGDRTSSPTPHTLVAVPNRDEDLDGRNSYSRLGRLAGREGTPGSGGVGGGGFDSRASKASSKRSHTVSMASKGRGETTGTPQAKPKSATSTGSSKALTAQKDGTVSRRRSRKAEAMAQSAAETIKKKGVCMVPIRMAVLFSGLQTVTSRLENPVPGVEDMFVTLSLDGPLLDEQQKQELNPMIIKIHSVTNLPQTPVPHDELKERNTIRVSNSLDPDQAPRFVRPDLVQNCLQKLSADDTHRCMPVHCKYSFFKLPSHTSLKKQHDQSIYWDDVNVVLAGTFEQSEFRQYLNGPPLEIEVHDRDRKPEEVKLKATLFGDDLEDEKISNVGTVASRRTLHNPFKDRAKIWDPYGIAYADLSDLLLGHRVLYLKIPIHNCPLPDLLGVGDSKMQGRIMGVPGSVDGPVENSMAAGHYVSNHTMLKIKVELAHPLITPERVAAKEPIPTTPECPFGRIVFKFDYKNTQFLNQIQTLVTKVNARALELDDMPQHVIDAALSTYKLSALQQESRTLDIVTGFQVLDGVMHLFVLEGLRDYGMKEIWETLPQPEDSDVVVLYNSNFSFSSRLYGPLDVDLCRVKLHEPLRQIVRQPLLYIRDMVPKPCFEALVKLNEMTKLKQVRGAVRNELFPTADMVVSMSKEFGVPFTTEDFEELQVHEEKSFAALPTTASTRQRSFVQEPTSRSWDPIDNLNMLYLEKLRDRDTTGPSKDFIQENRDELKRASEINKREKEMNRKLTVKADVDVAHNYSTQTLNSTELAKEKLRQILAKDPDTRYTYCQDYLHSMTVVPVNVEALKKQEKLESEAQWKTEEGWIYPGMKTTLEANVHPKKPHVAKLDELQEQWRENILHVGVLQPPLDRDRYPWELRGQDIELYRKPEVNFGLPEPNTIHLAGEKLRREKLIAKHTDQEEWKRKIVVGDTRQYFHRCLTETEMRVKGRNSSNQVAKLQGLLKDSPSKHSLRKAGMSLENIPPLNVVLNPSVDVDSRLAGRSTSPAVDGEGIERIKGFKPGPFEEHSWVLERNKIPAVDYEHHRFLDFKGRDFNVYHKQRSLMWKKPINPLTEEERDNHLFRIPDDPKRFRILPELTQSMKERSLTQPQMSTLSGNATLSQPRLSQLTVPTSFNDPTLTMTTTQGTGLSQPMGLQKSIEAAN